MASKKRFNDLQSETNTGFGVNGSDSGGRFYDRKRRTANVTKRGVAILERYSWYHTMLEMPRAKFLFLLFLMYIMINLAFAGIYYLIGPEHLAGLHYGKSGKNFTEVFFFSTQTFTTVGYGRISPTGFAAQAVSTFEAFLGLLSFAIATGLFYGRFSRPRAFLRFSNNALISPFKDGTALMFRTSPFKNTQLSEAEVKLTLAVQAEENGKVSNKFFVLPIELSRINALALSWTVVHPIDEKSPLYNFSEEDLKNTHLELLVFIQAFDEIFSNTVMTRYSYVASEIVWGAKFKMMYYPSKDKQTTILDLERLNFYDKVDLPVNVSQSVHI